MLPQHDGNLHRKQSAGEAPCDSATATRCKNNGQQRGKETRPDGNQQNHALGLTLDKLRRQSRIPAMKPMTPTNNQKSFRPKKQEREACQNLCNEGSHLKLIEVHAQVPRISKV